MSDEILNDANRTEPREMTEPIRNEVGESISTQVSWLIGPPKLQKRVLRAPELRSSSSPKSRPTRSVGYPPHDISSESSHLPQHHSSNTSHRIPVSPNRMKSSNISPPGSPNSVKTSTILRAWTKIFNVSCHEMYTLCEADIERGASLSPPSESGGDKDSRERDRVSAAIQRTKAVIYSVEKALLEYHALIRRSAVAARFEPQSTTIPEQSAEEREERDETGSHSSNNRNMSTNNSLDSLDPKKQSCAWVVSTRAPLTQKEAFDTVSDVLDSLQRYSQYTESTTEPLPDNEEPVEHVYKHPSEAVSSIFSQSSPVRRSKAAVSFNNQNKINKFPQSDIQPKFYKKPTPSSHLIAAHFRDDKLKTKLRPSAKEYVPPAVISAPAVAPAEPVQPIQPTLVIEEEGHKPEVRREVRYSGEVDGDDLSSLGGGTEDFGTDDGDEDYVERVVLSARQAVWSEAEAWVDAAEKIALSLHDDNSDEEENVLYGSDDGLSCDNESMDSFMQPKQTSGDVLIEDGCRSIDEDSVPGSPSPSTPLRTPSNSSSRISPWDSPRNASTSNASTSTSQRSPFNNLSHPRRKGDGIGNMKANHLLKLHTRHDQSSGTVPLLRGAEAKIVSSSKDILWRRNVADIEQGRAERMLKADGRRKAAYAKAMGNQEMNKKKLDASTERAAAVVSREQKKTAAFAVNNNQKVSEVMFMKSLSAEGFQFGLQQRLKECEEKVLATTNRRQAYLQLRAEKASVRNRGAKHQLPTTPTATDGEEDELPSGSIEHAFSSSECSMDELRAEAKRLGLQSRGTRKQLLSRIDVKDTPPRVDSKKMETSPDSGDRVVQKNKEMSARRLAHELSSSKRWAVLEKRFSKVLSSLGSNKEHMEEDDEAFEGDKATKPVVFKETTYDDKYYMSSSDDDEEEDTHEKETDISNQEEEVALEVEAGEDKRKNKKQQRRRKMKEQMKHKVKMAKEEALNESHTNRWVMDEEVKLELMHLRSEFHEILVGNASEHDMDSAGTYTPSSSLLPPSLKDMVVAVNEKVNNLWSIITVSEKNMMHDNNDNEDTCVVNFDEKDIKQSNLIRKLLGDLMVLKGMSRSHWTSNDHLKRRSDTPATETASDDIGGNNTDAASSLFSPQFFISPTRKPTSLDQMQVSPHIPVSPSVLPPAPPSILSADEHPSSPIYSEPPSPSPSATSSITNSLPMMLSPTSPLPSSNLFNEKKVKSLTFVGSLSSEGNVIRSLLRSLHLVSKITTSQSSKIMKKETRGSCSSMLTTTLTGISLWLEAHPKACATFFAYSSDSLSLLTVVDMLNSEIVQWVIAYRNGHRKPSDILLPLLSIVEKAVQFEPSHTNITAPQQVFWHYLCQSHFLVASCSILEWHANPSLVKTSTQEKVVNEIVNDHVIQILKTIGYLTQFVGADAFKNQNLNIMNEAVNHSDNHHIHKIMSLLNRVQDVTQGKEGKLVGIVRRHAVSILDKRNEWNSSKLSLDMFPNETSIELAKNSLFCLNRLHRLTAIEIKEEGRSNDMFWISPSLFNDLWCLSRLILTALSGGEVETSCLCDLRMGVEFLLDETIELAGFLTSHPPPQYRKKTKTASQSVGYSSKSEKLSLLRELLLLPFSMFVSHRCSLYPALLSIAIGSSKRDEDDGSGSLQGKSGGIGSALKGKLAGKHLSRFFKEVKCATVSSGGEGPSSKRELNDYFEMIVKSTDETGTPTWAPPTKEDGRGSHSVDLIPRTGACNALAVCAVANLEWGAWDGALSELDSL